MVKKKVTVQAGDNGSNFGNPIQKVGQDVEVLSKQLNSLGVDITALTSMFDRRYLKKNVPDVGYESIKLEKLLTLGGGMRSINSKDGKVTGLGTVLKQNYDGTNELEIDYISVRRQMFINELIIQQAKHTSGIDINSGGGLDCNRVELIDDTFENFPKQIADWINDSVLYRCYFDNKDGREPNTLTVGDCVLCQRIDFGDVSSPLKYYRKRVLGVGANYIDIESGGTTLPSVTYHEPSNGDDIAQWGHLWNKSRQSIIELNTLEGGRQSFFRSMGDCRNALPEDVRDFIDYESLSDTNKQLLWQSDLWYNDVNKTTIEIGYIDKGDGTFHDAVAIKGNFSATSTVDGKVYGIIIDNETGLVTIGAQKIMMGSSLLDISEEIESAKNDAQIAIDKIDKLQVGGANLLKNSGFLGDFTELSLSSDTVLLPEGNVYSDFLTHWDGDCDVVDSYDTVSGKSVIDGNLSQNVALIYGEHYVFGFKAKGTNLILECGDYRQEVKLNNIFTQYEIKFVFSGAQTLKFTINGEIGDIQLERGTIRTDWGFSPTDNPESVSQFINLKYLQSAIQSANTSISGGLVMTNILQLGNFVNGVMERVTSGVSGVYTDDNDIAFWGGGTFPQAIQTAMKFARDKNYRPTDEEWEDLANFVVTHGGDVFLRGYINALGGVFRDCEAINLETTGSFKFPMVGIGGWTNENNIIFNRGVDEIFEMGADMFGANHIGRQLKFSCFKNGDTDNSKVTTVRIKQGVEGKLFENGIEVNEIILSNEIITLEGIGDDITKDFYGYSLTSRDFIQTRFTYGSREYMLAQGQYTYSPTQGQSQFAYKTFDGSTLTFQRLDVGKYKIGLPINWNLEGRNYYVVATGMVSAENTAIFASQGNKEYDEQSNNMSFIVLTADDAKLNDGSFTFQIYPVSTATGWKNINF